jgi:hypothetical protein
MTSRYQGVSGSSYSNSSKRKQQLPWVVTTFSRDASSSIYPQLLFDKLRSSAGSPTHLGAAVLPTHGQTSAPSSAGSDGPTWLWAAGVVNTITIRCTCASAAFFIHSVGGNSNHSQVPPHAVLGSQQDSRTDQGAPARPTACCLSCSHTVQAGQGLPPCRDPLCI